MITILNVPKNISLLPEYLFLNSITFLSTFKSTTTLTLNNFTEKIDETTANRTTPSLHTQRCVVFCLTLRLWARRNRLSHSDVTSCRYPPTSINMDAAKCQTGRLV